MSRIVLLGGIGEALQLARRLAFQHQVIYSLAGRVQNQAPDLPCPVRIGAFTGVAELIAYLEEERVQMLIDATHPYAAEISHQAKVATQRFAIPLWAYRRPPWHPQAGDDWRTVQDWAELQIVLRGFHKPFFTLGAGPLSRVDAIPPDQHWLVRCLLRSPAKAPRLTLLNERGPFTLEGEVNLLRQHGVDVLLAKNSGGTAVAPKLEAARVLGIPVVMLARPPLPAVDRVFDAVEALACHLLDNNY